MSAPSVMVNLPAYERAVFLAGNWHVLTRFTCLIDVFVSFMVLLGIVEYTAYMPVKMRWQFANICVSLRCVFVSFPFSYG